MSWKSLILRGCFWTIPVYFVFYIIMYLSGGGFSVPIALRTFELACM